MTDVKVVDEFKAMGLPEVQTALATMATEAKGIFDAVKDASTGAVKYEAIAGDDAKRVTELNIKMAAARERYEELDALRGTDHTAARLSEFLNRPVVPVPAQPNGQKATSVSLGKAMFKALKETPRDGSSEWAKDFEVSRIISVKNAGGLKDVLGTDDTLTDVGAEYPPETIRVGTVVDTLYQPHNIAPLIPQVTTTQNAIPYMVETVTAQGAAETAEGALGAEANIDWAETLEPIRKITVLQPITEELLSDEAGIRAVVDGRLRQFMGNREDLQILQGNGTAPNLEGILNRTGVQNVNYSLTGADAQGLAEAALSAQNLVRTAFQVPGDTIMRVGTWEYIRLAKDADGQYLFAGPGDQAVPRLWGSPVRTNENMDNYTTAADVPILVGDWSGAATIFRRQGVTVQVSDSHDDRFARGVLTIRLVERLGLVVWRPAGFATVTRTA